jgi:hypothetical protein
MAVVFGLIEPIDLAPVVSRLEVFAAISIVRL